MPITVAGTELKVNIPDTVEIYRHLPTKLRPSWRLSPKLMQDKFSNFFQIYALARDELKDSPPDFILASDPPFTSFVAACFLARRFGAKLVLDSRHPGSRRACAEERGCSSDAQEQRLAVA